MNEEKKLCSKKKWANSVDVKEEEEGKIYHFFPLYSSFTIIELLFRVLILPLLFLIFYVWLSPSNNHDDDDVDLSEWVSINLFIPEWIVIINLRNGMQKVST